MSKGDNSPGASRLAGAFKRLTPDNHNAFEPDFGSIQGDGSLLTNTYPVAIPASDYLVCASLKKREVKTDSSSVGDHGGHRHEVTLGSGLEAGDRVLVVWVANDPVVVDVILPAESVI